MNQVVGQHAALYTHSTFISKTVNSVRISRIYYQLYQQLTRSSLLQLYN